ncbi:DUF5681 domain-containing protein [Parasphingorhabdus sp.]|uniref:DUF5681 domain-containing protein n=1 Tax=Parasphingorhabdus sp. TaxID=2709688 RepID=UPI0032ED0B11
MSKDGEPPEGEVGYGKPPMESRFKKGQSGNPAGRPKRKKLKESKPDAYQATKLLSKIIQSEANRTLTIREGEKKEVISVLTAAIRSLGLSAAKGNRFAQREFINLAMLDEKERRKSVEKEISEIVNYRVIFEQQAEDAKRLGLPEPECIPHPDDMFLNPETGEKDVNGPVTPEDKIHWDDLLQRRDRLAEQIKELAGGYLLESDPDAKGYYLEDWHFRQECFDRVNDNLPKRYRAELTHRSMRDGASQPGDQIIKHWPGE